MRKITKRSAAIIGATVVAISGGAAWAANSWFNGTGSAEAASSTVQTVTATATVADKLYPGKNANAAVTVTNPNDYSVLITDAKAPTVTVLSANDKACTAGAAKLSLGAVPNGFDVPGKSAGVSGTRTGTWSGFIGMEPGASAACAGATFKIDFTLDGSVA
jgi:hypothetical protein